MLRNFFARKKAKSNRRLSIVLQSSSITVAVISPDNVAVKQLPIKDGNYLDAINQLDQELSFEQGACQIVLAHGLYQTAQVDNPNVPTSEMCQALSWSAKELFTIKPDNQLIDYYQNHSNNSSLDKLVVVAADLSTLEPVVKLLQELEVEIVGISIEDIVVSQLLVHEKANVLVFHMPGSQVLIAIVENGKLCFSRRIHGYDNLHQMSESDFSLDVLTNLGLEIQRSIDYAVGQLRLDTIESIYIVVQNFDLDHMVVNLQEFFDIKVQKSTPHNDHELNRFPLNVAGLSELDLGLESK